MDQCSTYLSRSGPNPDLPSQSFATPEKVKEVHDIFKAGVKGEVDGWAKGLMRYLQDEETVRVLIPPAQVSLIRLLIQQAGDDTDGTAQNSIVEEYRKFHDLIRAEFDFTTAASIMTPSAVHTLLTSSANAKLENGSAVA